MLNLPKGYLSYSSISLWNKNKEQFRSRYYRNEPQYENAEMRFGKAIARRLEDLDGSLKDDPILREVARYASPEHAIEQEIEGVPIKAFIDSFDPERNAFREYKTGHLRAGGFPPWTKFEVAKHEQLPFYSLLIEKKHGSVEPLCHLDWLETRFSKRFKEFAGERLESRDGELVLTGRIETFPRRIAKWERKRMREVIRKAAEEISEDYTRYGK